jgi:ATP-dependent Clp protease protease subunit
MYIPSIIQNIKGVEFHYDLYSRLLKDRIIMLNTVVDSEIASSIVGQLLFLDNENNDEITLFINTPGGCVISGLSIYDTINMIKSPVRTVCIGQASSMGAFILCGGEKGRRFASKSSRIMIHSISTGQEGKYHDLKVDFKETEFLQNYLTEKIAYHTGQSLSKVKKDVQRDYFMSASEALKYGIVDEIL